MIKAVVFVAPNDRAADGSGCVTLASSVDVHVDDWNGGSTTWVRREIAVGSVDATIRAGGCCGSG